MPTTRPFLPSSSFALAAGIILSLPSSRTPALCAFRHGWQGNLAWQRGPQAANGERKRRGVEIVACWLVGAERPGRHAASFLGRQRAHGLFQTPRFVVQADPAQLADEPRQIGRWPRCGSFLILKRASFHDALHFLWIPYGLSPWLMHGRNSMATDPQDCVFSGFGQPVPSSLPPICAIIMDYRALDHFEVSQASIREPQRYSGFDA